MRRIWHACRFVFTGTLSGMTRDEASDLVVKAGGRVSGSVSSATGFVVCGAEPGKAKIDKAKSLGIRIITEDEFRTMVQRS